MNSTPIVVRNLVMHYGDVLAVDDLSFDVNEGECLALIGPSGCGKTTTLRALAGLEQPHNGEISIGGRIVFGQGGRINVATEHRRIGMVFQSYAIWPHLSVKENVAYPLRARGMRDGADEKVRKALDLVHLDAYADRNATALSGGQQQRVALARAIVSDPQVLLLDEPLSNLDARLRAQVRTEIRQLQRRLGITSVYVTHDQEEAFAVADRVIVLNGGRIAQNGRPLDVYDQPADLFVAAFVGSVNLIPGRIEETVHRNGTVSVAIPSGNGSILSRTSPSLNGAKDVVVAVRTVYPRISTHAPHSVNVLRVLIAARTYLGDWVEYLVRWRDQEIVVRRPIDEPRFEENAEVYLSIDPAHCVTLPA